MNNTNDSIKANVDRIVEFHKKFNLPVGSPMTMQTDDVHRLEFNLMIEELMEFKHACDNKDAVEILDAIADMFFVLISISIEHGVHDIIPELLDEVISSNMTKTISGEIQKRNDGKIITKGKEFVPVDFFRFVRKLGVKNLSLKG